MNPDPKLVCSPCKGQGYINICCKCPFYELDPDGNEIAVCCECPDRKKCEHCEGLGEIGEH